MIKPRFERIDMYWKVSKNLKKILKFVKNYFVIFVDPYWIWDDNYFIPWHFAISLLILSIEVRVILTEASIKSRA